MFNGEARFAGNYRSQWNKVPVNYLTFSGAVDKKFTSKQLKGSQVGGGLILNYDRAGDSKLSATKLGVVGSYIRPLNKSNLISIGLQIGIAQRAFSDSNLRFDNQWDGDLVNTNLSTGENFDNRSFFFSDFTVGANWRTHGPWKVGLSYDVNTSPFKIATRQYGGPEMSVIYRILNVTPLPYKPCPIF